MSEASASPAISTTHDSTRSLSAGSWGLVGMFGTLFSIAIAPAVDPDLGWHLGAGRWILRNHRVPLTDPFSWSVPGRKWIAHEWLTEVLMYALRTLGGDAAGDGLLIFTWAAIITTAWALLYRTARITGANKGTAAIVTAIGAVSSVHTWGVRPQMLTLLFVVITGMRLQTWRTQGGRTPWELIALMALWVNMHGGFIFGIVMVLVFACGAFGEFVLQKFPRVRGGHQLATPSRLAQIWLLFVGCVVASLASPNTLDGLIYPFTYLGDNASTRYVGEWFATDFSKVQFWPFAIMLGLTFVALMFGLLKMRIGLTEIALTVPFGYMGVQSMRNITQFAVCAVPIAASILNYRRAAPSPVAPTTGATVAETVPTRQRSAISASQKAMAVAVASATVVLSLVLMTRSDLTGAGNTAARTEEFPLQATQWLQQHRIARVFNHYNYGGWLVLNEIPVYVDGRPDMYGDPFMDDYTRVTGQRVSKDWQHEMKLRSANAILMPKTSPMVKAIDADIKAGRAPGWYEPTKDNVARLFVKR
jgi:hypothetical protein